MKSQKCCLCGAAGSGIRLFKFPANEPYRTKWKDFAGIEEIGTSKLCHKHFREDEITDIHRPRSRLKQNIVPTLKCNEIESSFDDKDLTLRFCLQCKTTDRRIHFRFPENVERRNKWLESCGLGPDFFNGEKHWYLCARHFSDGVILKKGPGAHKNRLRRNALPTLFMSAPVSNSTTTSNSAEPSSHETTIDYSFFPTRILPAIDVNVVITEMPSSTASVDLSATCNDSNDVILTEIPSSIPSVESSTVCNNVNNSRELTPATNCINSLEDYTSPTTISKILALHNNSACTECASFKRHIQSSLNDTSATQITPVPGKAVKRCLRYPGDISSPDYATPKLARRAVLFLKSEIEKKRRTIDILQKRNTRLEKTIEKYHDLISHLKQEDFLSDSE